MLNGIVGEAAFSSSLAEQLVRLRPAAVERRDQRTAVVVVVITFVTIVFGELVPKRIGQMYPEAVARLISRPMAGVAKAAKPFVMLLSATTRGMLKLMRFENTAVQQ